MTSEIRSLAALLPISIAASLIDYCIIPPSSGRYCLSKRLLRSFSKGDGLLLQIIIYFYLRADLLMPLIAHIPVAEFIVQNSGFYIIAELYFKNIFQHFLNIGIENGAGDFNPMIKISYHPVC